jgi:hypothetical protein
MRSIARTPWRIAKDDTTTVPQYGSSGAASVLVWVVSLFFTHRLAE